MSILKLAQVVEINIPKVPLTNDSMATVFSIVFGIAGGIAFLMVIIGGLQYVMSQGEPQATAKAKNTILYAVIGLAVCVLAFTIINFVIGRL